jgi:hypothetical protein
MIINPFSSIPVHPKSHVRGWSQHWANTLGTTVAQKAESYDNCESLYLDHGVNYGGGLNLFGGVTDEVFDRLKNLSESNGQLYSLDIDMPDYGLMLSKRIGQATCDARLNLIIDELKKIFKESKKITQYDINAKNIVIGDSHATSYAKDDSAIVRKNGQTLYGAIESGFIESCVNMFQKKYDCITLSLGAIDIRHHIMRQENPNKSLIMLLDKYIEIAKKISSELDCDIEIAAPHPIEHTERRIPKTGFYKGDPFYGSYLDRKCLVELFIEYIKNSGIRCVHQPISRYSINAFDYAKEYMELGSSVHLAPVHYRYNSDWGM